MQVCFNDFFYQSSHYVQQWQVGGLDHVLFFHMLEQLTFIFFRGVGIPPTRWDMFQFQWDMFQLYNLDQICEY